MKDFVVLAAAWALNRKVTTYDKDGNILPDDGEVQRAGAEQVYVFSEFMRDKGLLNDGVEVSRSAEFEIRWSEMTETGQRFTRFALEKWQMSLDRAPNPKIDASGLERRWAKFNDQVSDK